MASSAKYMVCPSCGIKIKLKHRKHDHYVECLCGDWLYYEPNLIDPTTEKTILVSNPSLISPKGKPRITVLAGLPPTNSTAPKVTTFKDHQPPVQPKTILNLNPTATHSTPQSLTNPISIPDKTQINKTNVPKGLLYSAGIFILVVLALITVWLFQDVTKIETEKRKRNYAQEQLTENNFLLAQVKFEELSNLYPNSTWITEYKCLAGIATLLLELNDPANNPETTFKKLKTSPIELAGCTPIVGTHYLSLINLLLEKSEPNLNLLDWAEPELALAYKQSTQNEDILKVGLNLISEKRMYLAKAAVLTANKTTFLNKLQLALASTPSKVFKEISRLLDEESLRNPELNTITQFTTAIDLAKSKHLDSILFEKDPQLNSPKPTLATNAILSSWKYFQANERIYLPSNWSPEDLSPIFTIVRGNLYAFERKRGRLLWAKRLGIDVENLPLLFSSDQGSKPIVITLEDNGSSLSALDFQGNTLWKTHLNGNCLANIITWNNSALVPCIEGFLLEVELSGGKITGKWFIGQTLLTAPSLHPESNTCFLAAEPGTILSLDLLTKKCKGIISTNHSFGALLGSPIPVFLNDFKEPSHLLVTQEELGPTTSLNVFSTPDLQNRYITGPIQKLSFPEKLSSPPVFNGNRLGILTESQQISFYSWRRGQGKSPPLVPFFDAKTQNKPLAFYFESLNSDKGVSSLITLNEAEAEIVFKGNYCKLLFAWNLRDGLKLTPSKPPFKKLGVRKSSAQEILDPALQKNAWAFTTSTSNGSNLVQLIDPAKNIILWKTLIAPVFNSFPLTLNTPEGKNSFILSDHSGNLFLTQTSPDNSSAPWTEGAFSLATNNETIAPCSSFLFQLEDKKSCLQLIQESVSNKVTLKRITLQNDNPQIESFSIPQINQPFASTPISLGDHILVPLASGNIVRISIQGKNALVTNGPRWKSTSGENNSKCHLAGLDKNTFCFSESINGISFFRWNNDPSSNFEKIKTAADISSPNLLELKTFVSEKGTLGTFLSTSGTFLSFLFTPEGAFSKIASFETSNNPKSLWSCKNENQQFRSALISNSFNFTWIDPLRGKSLWSTQLDAAPLVEPFVIEGKIFLFLTSGRSLLLDESKGNILEFELNLPSELFPSSCPFPALTQGAKKKFFIPFTDGTMLETSIEELIKPSGIVR